MTTISDIEKMGGFVFGEVPAMQEIRELQELNGVGVLMEELRKGEENAAEASARFLDISFDVPQSELPKIVKAIERLSSTLDKTNQRLNEIVNVIRRLK